MLNPTTRSGTNALNLIHIAPFLASKATQTSLHSHTHTLTAKGSRAKHRPARQEQSRVRSLARGHFDTPRARPQTGNPSFAFDGCFMETAVRVPRCILGRPYGNVEKGRGPCAFEPLNLCELLPGRLFACPDLGSADRESVDSWRGKRAGTYHKPRTVQRRTPMLKSPFLLSDITIE